jgi:hypothetical protein
LLTPEPFVDVTSLTVPVCRSTSDITSSTGFGTIPHATPTPIPGSNGTTNPSDGKTAEIITALKPILGAISESTVAADHAWLNANDQQHFAAVIFAEGRRVSNFCTALSLMPLTIDTKPFIDSVVTNLKGRQGLLSIAAELAQDAPSDIRDQDQLRIDSSEILTELEDSLGDFAQSVNVTPADPLPFTVVNPLLGLNVSVDAGWLLMRNGVDIVLLAPSERQHYSVRGLGPDAWKLGTALRVRRFRNAQDAELTDVLISLDSLFARFGDRVSTETTDIGNIEGALRVYRDVALEWDTSVGIAIANESTYLFEIGCSTSDESNCSPTMEQFLSTVTFGDG